jgi:hypothetical protein
MPTIDETVTAVFAASSSESYAKIRIPDFAINSFASSTRVPKTKNNQIVTKITTLQTNNDRNIQVQFGCRLDNALSNDVAAHNTAENID